MVQKAIPPSRKASGTLNPLKEFGTEQKKRRYIVQKIES